MKRRSTQRNNIKRGRAQASTPKDFMTPRAVADRSGIGLMGIYALLKSGRLPAVRVGNRFYIPTAAYQEYLASWGQGKQPKTAA